MDRRFEIVLPGDVAEQVEATAATEGKTVRQWITGLVRAAVKDDVWWVARAVDGGEYPPWGEGGSPREQIAMRLNPRGEKIVRRAFEAALDAQPVELSMFYDRTGTLLISARAPKGYQP